jgi:hypothetical protein
VCLLVCVLTTGPLPLANAATATVAPSAAKAVSYTWIRAKLGSGASWLPYGSSLYHSRAYVDVVVFPPAPSQSLLYVIELKHRPAGWVVVKASHSAQDCHIGSGKVECSSD